MDLTLKTIISDISRNDISEIHDSDEFVNDLGFASIDFADLLNQTELECEISMPDTSPTVPYKNMTVGQYLSLVWNLMEKKKNECS